MEAVLLAAGRGTRLLPLTAEVPKVMMDINGKPLMEIIINQLKSVGVTKIIIIVRHLKEKIINYFADGSKFGVFIEYVDQKEMKGTGHAVLQAKDLIFEEKFLCLAADSLFETSLLERVLSHQSEGVLVCKDVQDPENYGVLNLDGILVKGIVEKPKEFVGSCANLSVYLFPKQIFSACSRLQPSSRGELEVTDAIQDLIDSGVVFEHEKVEKIIDVGTKKNLEEARVMAKELGL